MNPPPARRLARYVEPELDERRIDRVWARIGAPRVHTSSWRVPAVAAAAVAAVVIAVVVVRGRAAPASLAGLVIESGAGQTLTLPDGTTATLSPEAKLRFDRIEASRVEATVERGEVAFDVQHIASRTWTVHAAGYDVVDRGTRFVVTVRADGVRVRVESGGVAVVRSGSSEEARALGPGESWASGIPADASAAATAELVPPAASPADEAMVAAPSTASTTGHAAAPVPSAPSPPGPRELLETANAARLAGRPRDAAQAFDALRTRYRSDPRAGLAAFELGRLRLDALGDPAGAVDAFADAMALAPGAGFREDAEARRVEALDRLHDGRCAAARRAYLERYPGGLHAATVGARCP